jgi:RHS repeat-associated core domain
MTETDTYTYNGDGLRTTLTTNTTGPGTGTTQNMTWAARVGIVPALLSDSTNDYIYGPSGQPIEQVSASGAITYLHADQYASTRLLTVTHGTTVGAYDYTPTGQTIAHTGTATTQLRWNGQYQDPDTGLYYLRNRYYDPTTAQFTTPDPLLNLTHQPYAYAGGDPLNAQDPLGLSWWNPFSWSPTTRRTAGLAVAVVALNVVEVVATDGAATPFLEGEDAAILGTAEEASAVADDAATSEVTNEAATCETAALDATPGGRPYTAHYLNDTGPVRNIPGNVVDETIDHGEVFNDLGDRTVYYDPKNDVTVVLSKTTGKIISARRGMP